MELRECVCDTYQQILHTASSRALSRHPANVVCSHARSRITFAPAWFSAPTVPVVRDVRYAQTRYEHARLRIVCGAHPPFLFECLAIPAVVKIAQRNYVSNANLLLIIGQLNNYAWLDRKRDATINPKRGLSTPVLPACASWAVINFIAKLCLPDVKQYTYSRSTNQSWNAETEITGMQRFINSNHSIRTNNAISGHFNLCSR